MSQLVIIWVNLLYGLDVDLSFPAAQNWQITLDFMAPVPFFSHGGVTFISAHMTVIGCWVSYFLCVSLDHLSHGNTLSLGFEQMCSDPEDLQVEGTTVSLHQANFGMSRMTKLPMRRLRGCQRTGGREGGREGVLGGGLRWIKRGRECSSPLWGVLGTFMSVWRAGDPVRGARESVNSCCPVLRVSWESSSPVAVMGFRAVLLSLLLVSLSLTRGAVITGVSETNLVKSFSVFFICKLDSCLICF